MKIVLILSLASASLILASHWKPHDAMQWDTCPDGIETRTPVLGNHQASNECYRKSIAYYTFQRAGNDYICARELECDPGYVLNMRGQCIDREESGCFIDGSGFDCHIKTNVSLPNKTCEGSHGATSLREFCSVGYKREDCDPNGFVKEVSYIIRGDGEMEYVDNLVIVWRPRLKGDDAYMKWSDPEVMGTSHGDERYCNHFDPRKECMDWHGTKFPVRGYLHDSYYPAYVNGKCETPVRCFGKKKVTVYRYSEIELYQECNKCQLKCHPDEVTAVVPHEGLKTITFCGKHNCKIEEFTNDMITFQRDFHSKITDEKVEVKVDIKKTGLHWEASDECMTYGICESLDCVFCMDYVMNPKCYSLAAKLLAILFITIAMFVIGVIMFVFTQCFKVLTFLFSGVFSLTRCMWRIFVWLGLRSRVAVVDLYETTSETISPESIKNLRERTPKKGPRQRSTGRDRQNTRDSEERKPLVSKLQLIRQQQEQIRLAMTKKESKDSRDDSSPESGGSGWSMVRLGHNFNVIGNTRIRAITLALILLLRGSAAATAPCSGANVHVIPSEECTEDKNKIICSTSTLLDVPLLSYDQTSCANILSPAGVRMGEVQITPTMVALKCEKTSLYYTREHRMQFDTITKCPMVGQCSINWCASVDKTTRIDGWEKLNVPSHQACLTGDTCFMVPCLACLWSPCHPYRWYPNVIGANVYEVFECSRWTPVVTVFVEEHLGRGAVAGTYDLTPGYSKSINEQLSISLEMTINSVTPKLSTKFLTDTRRIAMTTASEPGFPQAGLIGQLQCNTSLDAQDLSSCYMSDKICDCSVASTVLSCDCTQQRLEEVLTGEGALPAVIGENFMEVKNGQIYMKMPAYGSAKVQVKYEGRLVTMKSKEVGCTFKIEDVSGCYSCISGSRMHYKCRASERFTTIANCTKYQIQVSCSPDDNQRVARFSAQSPYETMQCTIPCSDKKQTINGVFDYVSHPELNEASHIQLVPKDKEVFSLDLLGEVFTFNGLRVLLFVGFYVFFGGLILLILVKICRSVWMKEQRYERVERRFKEKV